MVSEWKLNGILLKHDILFKESDDETDDEYKYESDKEEEPFSEIDENVFKSLDKELTKSDKDVLEQSPASDKEESDKEESDKEESDKEESISVVSEQSIISEKNEN